MLDLCFIGGGREIEGDVAGERVESYARHLVTLVLAIAIATDFVLVGGGDSGGDDDVGFGYGVEGYVVEMLTRGEVCDAGGSVGGVD